MYIDFFERLWPNVQGHYVSLFFRKEPLNKVVNVSWDNKEHIENTIKKFVKDEWDCYFGVCLRGRYTGEWSRGNHEDVSVAPGLWLDIDIAGPAHKSEELPPSIEAAANILDELNLSPSLGVDSGHGLHLYWLFDKPLIMDAPEKKEKFQGLCRNFYTHVKELFKKHGYKVDNVSDIARVLRIPGTKNYKLVRG